MVEAIVELRVTIRTKAFHLGLRRPSSLPSHAWWKRLVQLECVGGAQPYQCFPPSAAKAPGASVELHGGLNW